MLHGDSMELRQVVVEVLLKSKGSKLAYRYAMCGLADRVISGGEGCHVQPMGCGHRLCPRCGRRRGAKYAKRIIGWLGHESHGDLWSVVLTQQVRKGESLVQARNRMAVKQRRYLRALTARGMVAGMTTVHVVWSKAGEGWHYHVHVLAEMPGGRTTAVELLEWWSSAAGGEYVQTGEEQSRLVLGAGGPVAELRDDQGDSDFWSESKGPVARAVQYPLRDMAQGVSAWRLGGDLERVREATAEIQRSATGWKMFRAWGRWRKVCPAAVVAEVKEDGDESSDTEAKKAPPGQSEEALGTVHQLHRRAKAGEEFAKSIFVALEPTVRNASDFAKRFVAYCRVAITGPPRPSGVHHE